MDWVEGWQMPKHGEDSQGADSDTDWLKDEVNPRRRKGSIGDLGNSWVMVWLARSFDGDASRNRTDECGLFGKRKPSKL
jgi:hypothetical protein